ncbi:cytochrome c oxidase subunit 4 isoform 1, mitochondrial [Anabrus simplex]|uniref:cytochrome c oxidase subunit 4 isoform 1, mitochondrial n=1 Tax=Anabrus simplex TaxID=316456 RepID=UPI0034DD7D0F
MASRLLSSTLRQAQRMQTASITSRAKIGNREVVGFGFNGQPNYVDRVDFPMPAIRFKENSPDIQALREKEKGDWRKLNLEEKKALYRASFCQTFAEMKAPTGEWKSVIGLSLIAISLSMWIFMGMKLFVYRDLPESFDEDRKEAQLKRMIDLRVNPVDGLTSKWDYEQGKWK